MGTETDMGATILEKLKNLSLRASTWIALAVGAVILYIIALRNKILTLGDAAARAESEKKTKEETDKLKELHDAANSAEDDYNRTRDAYLKQSGDGSGEKKS